MRLSIELFRELENFYWDHLDDSNPSSSSFCDAFTKLVGNSDEPGNLNQLALEDFENVIISVSDSDELIDDSYEKALKKACKTYGFTKVFSTFTDLAFLAGIHHSISKG